MQTPSKQPGCRCGGSGAYTEAAEVANTTVPVHRVCLKHLARRTRLKDTSTNRIGEVMDVSTAYQRVHLRPVGGGREWTVDVGSLEPLTESA